jgi:TRAP-type C4-dicarboxylate transport system substrate-binding protein
VWENGFRNITTNTKPIVKPVDLAGMKLRVPQGKWRVKMFQAYGASRRRWRLSESSSRCRPASWTARRTR